MSESSPMIEAQQKYADKVPFRSIASEEVALEQSLGRITAQAITAPIDSPPYPRAIVEGFLVETAATRGASEDSPVSFQINGIVKPGDESVSAPSGNQGIETMTGSICPAGDYSIVRMWEAKRDGDTFTIERPFPPGFFIEAQGCDIAKGSEVLAAGHKITPADIGALASLGISKVQVACVPKVTLFASGDEVLPYTETLKPGAILDCNTPMLSAAVNAAGAQAIAGGIQSDDFDAFVATAKTALNNSDMLLISGGTAVDGRDFISDLIRELGELVIDGVQMRSGRPLIMGVANGKPIVCVAGHPPEALRGFTLFGIPAIDRITGHEADLPEDPSPPPPMQPKP